MPSDQRPPFATYLLPSITFSSPFSLRRRQQSTSSTISAEAVPSLSSSPISSISTSPSSSPATPLSISPPPSLCQDIRSRSPFGSSTVIRARKADRLSRVQPNIIKCAHCSTDIAFASQIVSKGFTGRHGRAYLVSPPPRRSFSRMTKKVTHAPTDLANIKTGRSVNRELLTGAHVVADVSCVICQTVLGWKYVDAKEHGQRYKIGKFILETKRVVVEVSWEDVSGSSTGKEDADHIGEQDGDDEVIVFDEDDEDECEDLFAGTWDANVVAKRRGKRVDTWKRVM